jgi:hypothetical protein
MFQHVGDEGVIEPDGTCSACGKLIPPEDLLVLPGPGYDRAADDFVSKVLVTIACSNLLAAADRIPATSSAVARACPPAPVRPAGHRPLSTEIGPSERAGDRMPGDITAEAVIRPCPASETLGLKLDLIHPVRITCLEADSVLRS